MITEREPSDWRGLQRDAAQVLAECGMDVEIEKTVGLARGQAEVDVHAVETVRGRSSTIYCECKHWKSSVPQQVVHAFRTVVADGGANTGYLISSSSFQRGAFAATELTNVRLVTWREFQAEFEETWVSRHLRPRVTERLDPLLSYVEPFMPRTFSDLDERGKRAFIDLRDRHFDFGAIVMLFTTYTEGFPSRLPSLPLEDRYRPSSSKSYLPPEMLSATGYRDLMDAMIPYGERVIAELRASLRP